MQTKEIKIRFDAGTLSACTIVDFPLEQGAYALMFSQKNKSTSITMKAQRGGMRKFKSIDGAATAAKHIGFRKITIEYSA
jgi:hypothetical protein